MKPKNSLKILNDIGQFYITYLLFITGIICISFLIAYLSALEMHLYAIAIILGFSVFIISFVNTEAALYIFIFSMLLGPEFIVGQIGGSALLGRGITLRFDDFLLVIIGFSWFAKSAIYKELGLFLRTPLNLPIFFYTISSLFVTCLGMITGSVNPLSGFFYVLKYIEYFIVYFMVVNHLHSEVQLKRFVFCSLLTCLLVSLYGLYQIPLGGRITAPFEGEIGEPNTFGSGLFLHPGKRKSSYQYMLGVVIFISFITLLFTLSRSSYLAFVFLYLSLIIFSEKKLFLLSLLFLALIISPFITPLSVKERVMFTFTQPKQSGQVEIGKLRLDTSASARIIDWTSALSDFTRKPLFGYGVTGYGFMDAQIPRILLETGFLGLTAFLYLMYSIFKMAYQRLKEATVPYNKGLVVGYLAGFIALLFHAIGTNTFIIVRIMEPFWLFTGIVVMLPFLEEAKQTQMLPEIEMNGLKHKKVQEGF